ncbi:class I SAM-dependent methyltransferase [Amycolatopsis sp. NPDC003861]
MSQVEEPLGREHESAACGGVAARRRLSRRDELVRAQFNAENSAHGYASSYQGVEAPARYFASRIHVMLTALRQVSRGNLVDVGCGPGMFLRSLLDERGDELRISGIDQSSAMVAEAADRFGVGDDVRLCVGQADDTPFADASFDVVTAMGVLEYCDIEAALREFSRIVRPGGLVVVTMLNPLSVYRLFEWVVYWPILRLLGWVEGRMGIRTGRRHGAPRTGIRAVTAGSLRRKMADAGLRVEDTVHYDLTVFLPPLDKWVWQRWRRWMQQPEKTVSRGPCRWLGTAYLVVAHRSDEQSC